MTAVPTPFSADQLSIVPANEASWSDLAAIFGTKDAGPCLCQRLTVRGWIWRDSTLSERTAMLEDQTACGEPDAKTPSGLVLYAAGEPAGWVAVEPRAAYPKLAGSPVPWKGRTEDKADEGVWAVTCFVVRKGYRAPDVTI